MDKVTRDFKAKFTQLSIKQARRKVSFQEKKKKTLETNI